MVDLDAMGNVASPLEYEQHVLHLPTKESRVRLSMSVCFVVVSAAMFSAKTVGLNMVSVPTISEAMAADRKMNASLGTPIRD